MVLIILCGVNGQNNVTKSDRCLIKGLQTEKNGGKHLIKEFPNNTITSFEHLLLSITVTFVVADGPLTSINQTYSVNISNSVCFTR